MNEYNNTPHELEWDDEITNDGGEYVLLEEGDYNFTVTAFERGRFPGSREGGKIPPCKKAVLTLTVSTAEGDANVKYDIILWSSLEWKISEFFRSIGQKKHGEPLRPRWGEVVGAQGRARFKPRTYTKNNGEQGTVNGVEKFYDYDPKFFNASAAPTAPQVAGRYPAGVPGGYTPGKF